MLEQAALTFGLLLESTVPEMLALRAIAKQLSPDITT